jgi:CBS domain containing-hemolysin-like protein
LLKLWAWAWSSSPSPISLIIGELVPKQIALHDPERIAVKVVPAMALLSKVSLPLVWLLDGSGKFILRLLGQKGAGVIESEEKDMISGDMLEAMTGVSQDEDEEEPAFVIRNDGSFLVSGWMPIDEFADKIGGPVARDADYETIAGFVIDAMGRLPEVGEVLVKEPWRFEIIDLDGRRTDKLLVSRD